MHADESDSGRILKAFDQFQKTFGAVTLEVGARLELGLEPDWDGALGMAGFDDGVLTISVGKDFLKYEGMTRDALDLVLCHELGHYLGAPPKKQNHMNNSGPWASGEGESDYFAGVCLRKLWGSQGEAGSVIVQRAVHASEVFFGILHSKYSKVIPGLGPAPSGATRDSRVTENYLFDYPGFQCRLDSVRAGAVGDLRPSCWYFQSKP